MKKFVCIIDDDDDIRDAMSYALEIEGYDVQGFANPVEAMNSLKLMSAIELPGFIMVDYHMPDMDGVTLVNKFLTEYGDTIGKVPLAICSAEDDLAGMLNFPTGVLHMNKPMELDHFVQTIRSHFKD